jgi:HEAT repeat protein
MERTEITLYPILAKILKEMNAAVRKLGMYPPNHPANSQTTEMAFSAFQEVFDNTDQITFTQMGDAVVINGHSMEDGALPKRLRKEFQNRTIQSLTFTNTLTPEEFARFLTFLAVPVYEQSSRESLPEFLRKNQMDSIKINQLKYELVSEDEVVVKTEVMEEADLKAQLSKVIKQSPDLVKDILLNRTVKPESSIEGWGTEVNLNELMGQIQQQVKNFTDDEVLSLLTSGLEETVKKSESPDKKSVVNEEVSLVHKLLQDIERNKLLPEVKKILSQYRFVEQEYLDFIFDEKWLKTQSVLDELMEMMNKLGTGEVDFDRFMFLIHRVIHSEEEKIRSYAIDKLLPHLDSKNDTTRRLSVLALKEILSYLISGKMEDEFVYLKDRICDRIKDQPLSGHVCKDLTGLVKIIFFEMIKRNEFKEAKEILNECSAKLSQEVSDPQEAKEIGLAFLKEVSDDSTLLHLTSQLKEGESLKNTKVIEEILESLDKDKVAGKLLEIFTQEDRAARISSLKVLSRLGQSAISALSRLLSDKNAFVRKEASPLLIDEHWYKVRNAIYVLGNIPESSSVEVLVRLNSDPDLRVRLEVIKALEKIGKEESVNALLTFLKDRDEEVRKNAISSLGALSDSGCLNPLMDHFRQNPEDRTLTLTTIDKLGGEQIIEFLLGLLSEEDSGIGHVSKKQKEEIQSTALNILGKIGPPSIAKEIEKFMKNRKKGIRALLTKDPLRETASRMLKKIKDRT